MKKEEIQENNRLIAEFMYIQVTDFAFDGKRILCYGDENDAMDFKNIRFYNPMNNWNELMPVVDKIELMGKRNYEVQIQTDRCTIFDMSKEPENATSNYPIIVNEMLEGEKIIAVYKAVIKFIKWCNENNK